MFIGFMDRRVIPPPPTEDAEVLLEEGLNKRVRPPKNKVERNNT